MMRAQPAEVDGDTPALRSAADAARMVWDESKRLWGIGLPIAVGTLSAYALSSVTQMFAGHLGHLPLAAAVAAARRQPQGPTPLPPSQSWLCC